MGRAGRTADADFPGERPVLVVDDDAGARKSLVMLLEAAGHTTLAYASAAALAEQGIPANAACLLLDVRLGEGEDGVSLLERLRGQGDRTPVVMVTGHGDVPLAVRAMRAGAVDFVEKPYTTDRLLAALDAARAVGASRARAQALVAGLTGRERDVLDRLIEGKSNKGVAAELGISARTVEAYRAAIMAKLGVRSLAETVRVALAAGLGG